MRLNAFIATLTLSLSLASCIQDEAPNAEADILTCTVPAEILKQEPLISNNRVTIMVKSNTDLTQLAPVFTLTKGATIDPVNETVRNFVTPQYYTITSEDGKWKKRYEVSFDVAGIKTQYNFEHWQLTTKQPVYQEFYEITNDTKQYIWATGNGGYAMTGTPDSKLPNGVGFPTTSWDFGTTGKAIKLETKSTGGFGALFNMPIAAGNIFIGSFDIQNATKKPLEATLFGLPFEQEPIAIKGWYKYTPGVKFTNKNKEELPDRRDACDIYAVFYETDSELKSLNGANVLTNPNIVSLARIENPGEPTEFTPFYLLFQPKNGKVIDKEKLKNSGYNMAVVLSSSIDGAYFEGAVGSTLIVDEVELICKAEEE